MQNVDFKSYGHEQLKLYEIFPCKSNESGLWLCDWHYAFLIASLPPLA